MTATLKYFLCPFFSACIIGCGKPSHVPDSLEKAGETVWIEGGVFEMGDMSKPDAQPVITQKTGGFWMHRYEVTVAGFQEFVNRTGYITQAEKQGGSYVFVADAVPDSLSLPGAPWWQYTPGADWKHPQGPASTEASPWNPVAHIGYADACAYCEWLHMRLPTEAEREYVTRQDETGKTFNHWQGNFPFHNQNTDGFEGISPVGSFPAGKTGLYDLRGNVWEWCADPYHSYAYVMADQLPLPLRAKGPAKGYDPDSPDEETRVIRGGSYLCSENYCSGYLPFTRMRSSTALSFGHIGFRCVKSGKH